MAVSHAIPIPVAIVLVHDSVPIKVAVRAIETRPSTLGARAVGIVNIDDAIAVVVAIGPAALPALIVIPPAVVIPVLAIGRLRLAVHGAWLHMHGARLDINRRRLDIDRPTLHVEGKIHVASCVGGRACCKSRDGQSDSDEATTGRLQDWFPVIG